MHNSCTNGCSFSVEASATGPKSPTKEHKQDQEDKESKQAVLELVLSRCTSRGTASSNSSGSDVRYSLRDATEVCLGHRDTYTTQTTVDNFRASRAFDWWSSRTENVYGRGYYGTQEVVQALIEFIAQQTPNREVLPTPRQAIKSVLDYCAYKQGVEDTEAGICYYNLDEFVKNLGIDPWSFHDLNRVELAKRGYYFEAGMFWVTEDQTMELVTGDDALIHLGKSGVAGNIRQAIQRYDTVLPQLRPRLSKPKPKEEVDRGYCRCHKKKGACTRCICVRAKRPCTYQCECSDKCGSAIKSGPCRCSSGECSTCRCVKRGEACDGKCGCKGACRHTDILLPLEGPVLPMETEGPFLPMDVEQESPPEPKSPPPSPPPDQIKGPRVAEPRLEPDAVPTQPCDCKGACDPTKCRCKIDKLFCTSACDCKGGCDKSGCICQTNARGAQPSCNACTCAVQDQGCTAACTCKGECRYKGRSSDTFCSCAPTGDGCAHCRCSRKGRVCGPECTCKGACGNIETKKRKAEKPLKSILKKKVRFTLDLTDQKEEEPQNGLDVLAAASSAASTSSTSPPTPMDTTPQPQASMPPPAPRIIQVSQMRPPARTTRLSLQRPAAPASEYAASFAAGAAAAVQQPPVRMDTQPDQLTRVATQIRIAQAAQDIFKSLRTPTQADIEARDAMSSMALQRMVEEMRKK